MTTPCIPLIGEKTMSIFPHWKTLKFKNPFKPYIPDKDEYKGHYSVIIMNKTTDNVYWYGRDCSYDEAHWLGVEAVDDFAGDDINIYVVDQTDPIDPFIIQD